MCSSRHESREQRSDKEESLVWPLYPTTGASLPSAASSTTMWNSRRISGQNKASQSYTHAERSQGESTYTNSIKRTLFRVETQALQRSEMPELRLPGPWGLLCPAPSLPASPPSAKALSVPPARPPIWGTRGAGCARTGFLLDRLAAGLTWCRGPGGTHKGMSQQKVGPWSSPSRPCIPDAALVL